MWRTLYVLLVGLALGACGCGPDERTLVYASEVRDGLGKDHLSLTLHPDGGFSALLTMSTVESAPPPIAVQGRWKSLSAKWISLYVQSWSLDAIPQDVALLSIRQIKLARESGGRLRLVDPLDGALQGTAPDQIVESLTSHDLWVYALSRHQVLVPMATQR